MARPDWLEMDYNECIAALEHPPEAASVLDLTMVLGRALRLRPDADGLSECMPHVVRLAEQADDEIEFMRLYEHLHPFWDDVPEETRRRIEDALESFAIQRIYLSVSDLSILKVILSVDPEFLRRILSKCRHSWFRCHRCTYTDPKTGERITERVPGIPRAGNEELYDFIAGTGIRMDAKQRRSIRDVMNLPYLRGIGVRLGDLPPETMSHHGTVVRETCLAKEDLVPRCLKVDREKIGEGNRKGQKTPDFLVRGDGARPDMVIEVYSGTDGDLDERVRRALHHGDEKEEGRGYWTRAHVIGGDAVRVAALAVDDMTAEGLTGEMLGEYLGGMVRPDTRMDLLLVVFRDVLTHRVSGFVAPLGDVGVPDVFSENVTVFSLALDGQGRPAGVTERRSCVGEPSCRRGSS